jgi:hypothetical protein
MIVTLTSRHSSASVDLARGGDIVSYVDSRVGEVLWRSDSQESGEGERAELSRNTQAFYDSYRGGIQELFPNTADATKVLGAELPFHGELCRTSMTVLHQTSSAITAKARLRRYPVEVTRRISLDETGGLTMTSEVHNLSGRALPYVWGLHPVFSDTFTGPGASLWCRVREATSHPHAFANQQAYAPGSTVEFGEGPFGDYLPLSPGDSGTADLVYVELEESWFQLGKPDELNLLLRWSNEDFNCLWLWQECRGEDDWPWWGQHHIVGVEPHTAFPATTLEEHIREGRHLVLGPHETADARFVFELVPGVDMTRKDEQ